MTRSMIIQYGSQALNAGMSNADPKWQKAALLAYGATATVGVDLPFSRKDESEADHIGLIYMARAGYDPEAAIGFWQRFAEFNQQQGGNTPAFLRTHPTDETRIQQLRSWMPEAKAQIQH